MTMRDSLKSQKADSSRNPDNRRATFPSNDDELPEMERLASAQAAPPRALWRRKAVSAGSAVAIVFVCAALAGSASQGSNSHSGASLAQSVAPTSAAPNDYVLTRQAMHSAEKADAASRLAALAEERASGVKALEKQAAVTMAQETAASNAALKRYADMVSSSPKETGKTRLPFPVVQVKHSAPTEKRARSVPQQLAEESAGSSAGGLKSLVSTALEEMERIAARLRSTAPGQAHGDVDLNTREALHDIVSGAGLQLKGLEERIGGGGSRDAEPRGALAATGPRDGGGQRDRRRDPDADAAAADERWGAGAAEEAPRRARERESALGRFQQQLVEGATRGQQSGEDALDAAIAAHEAEPMFRASDTPDPDPRRAFEPPRLEEARGARGERRGERRGEGRGAARGLAPAAPGSRLPSMSSMQSKLRAWEAARRAGAPAPAPAAEALAARAPPVVQAVPQVLTVCESVNAAHAGDAAEAEGACGRQEECHFDFGRQACVDGAASA
jgi:hypothetical protein